MIEIHRRADQRDPARPGGRCCDGGCVPAARRQLSHVLQMEGQVRRAGLSEAKRLKALEDENLRLKRMLADAMLDNAALKDLLGKKW